MLLSPTLSKSCPMDFSMLTRLVVLYILHKHCCHRYCYFSPSHHPSLHFYSFMHWPVKSCIIEFMRSLCHGASLCIPSSFMADLWLTSLCKCASAIDKIQHAIIYCKFRETESSLLSSCSFLLSQIEQLLCSGLKANGDFFTASRKYCCWWCQWWEAYLLWLWNDGKVAYDFLYPFA